MRKSPCLRCVLVFIGLAISDSGFSAEARVPWNQGNHVVVELSSSGVSGEARYELWVSGPGDVRVESDERADGEKNVGSILLVGGQFIAVRGLEVQPGMEIDAMDVPALTWQLAAQLLERVVPGGPEPSVPNKELKVTERTNGIEVGTMSAGAEYGAPWTVVATLSRHDGGPINYRLEFRYTDAESGKLSPPMRLSGSWEHQQPPPEVPDSLSLTGWKLFSVGPVTKAAKDGTIYDYSTSSLEKTVRSLGDLRKLVRDRH